MFETMHMEGKGANIKKLGFFFLKKDKTKRKKRRKDVQEGLNDMVMFIFRLRQGKQKLERKHN